MRNLRNFVFLTALVFVSAQNILAQNDFYSSSLLKSDFNEVDAVVHIRIKSLELIDQIGGGDCENGKGGGYCLYRLKAEVKEIFKGKIVTENFEFYTVVEPSIRTKSFLSGEKIVFLNWSDNYPDKKMSLGTMENSTRSIENGVIKKLRKIAKKK